jgi:hypothetical protein
LRRGASTTPASAGARCFMTSCTTSNALAAAMKDSTMAG